MNRQPEDRQWQGFGPAQRMLALGFLLFLILVARLFMLQVLGSENYLTLSEDNRLYSVRIPASRGLILDRRGRILAGNVAACEVSIPPRPALARPAMLGDLAEILDCAEEELRERLEGGEAEGRSRVVLDRDLSKLQILVLEERSSEFPGLELEDRTRRIYPFGEMASHILGYVGEVDTSEVARRDNPDPKAYRSGDRIGRAGIEETYERTLRGSSGKKLVVVNARGDHLETWLPGDPIAGANLVLSLDLELTAVLDSALTLWGAGAGVVVDVHSGEILAAASRPSFDPNLFAGGISPEIWRSLSSDPRKPLYNRITQAAYSPGSTFKPLLILEALSTGVASPQTLFQPCHGGLRLGRRFFRCWDPGGHGRVNAVGALEQSCDVYFYQLGELLGIDAIAAEARRFGLETPCGIDTGGETRGLMPDSRWYNERYGEEGWTRGHVWNVAIGQGEVLVNCLQMARVYAALGNGGFLPLLRLRHHTEDVRGVTELPFSPSRGERLEIDGAALAVVREGLVQVLHGEDGTARASRLPDFETAGKTGTVQNPHGRPHAWFCGYAPAEQPEIAVALIIEHGEHGSDVAPIFRHLVATWFDLDVTPRPMGPPRYREGQ